MLEVPTFHALEPAAPQGFLIHSDTAVVSSLHNLESWQAKKSLQILEECGKIIQRASTVNEDSKDSNEDTSQMYSAVADLYHEFRPRYPKDLLDEAIQKSELLVSNGEKSRILEIGCGPGTLTLPLAQRGYQVVAVEPGSGMIAKAQEVCQDYSNVEFHRKSFKDYVQKEDVPFDAIIAATSLHWALAEVDQPALIQKMAGLLKDGGHLLLFWNFPPEPEDAVLDKVAEALGRPTHSTLDLEP